MCHIPRHIQSTSRYFEPLRDFIESKIGLTIIRQNTNIRSTELGKIHLRGPSTNRPSVTNITSTIEMLFRCYPWNKRRQRWRWRWIGGSGGGANLGGGAMMNSAPMSPANGVWWGNGVLGGCKPSTSAVVAAFKARVTWLCSCCTCLSEVIERST